MKLFSGSNSGIAYRRHLPEIQDGGRWNEMYRSYGYMAEVEDNF